MTWEIIERYQTLITGLCTLVAGGFVIIAVFMQLRSDFRRERGEKKERVENFSIIMSFEINEFIFEANVFYEALEESRDKINTGVDIITAFRKFDIPNVRDYAISDWQNRVGLSVNTLHIIWELEKTNIEIEQGAEALLGAASNQRAALPLFRHASDVELMPDIGDRIDDLMGTVDRALTLSSDLLDALEVNISDRNAKQFLRDRR